MNIRTFVYSKGDEDNCGNCKYSYDEEYWFNEIFYGGGLSCKKCKITSLQRFFDGETKMNICDEYERINNE